MLMDDKLTATESKVSVKELIDIVLISIILLVPSVMLLRSNIPHDISATFFVNILIMTFFSWVILVVDDRNIANIFIFIFFYLFFTIAPIIQLSEDNVAVLINTLPTDYGLISYSNILTSIFLTVYLLFYIYFFLKKGKFIHKNNWYSLKEDSINEDKKKYIFYILFILSAIAVIMAVLEIRSRTVLELILENRGEKEDNSSSLFRSKFVYSIPLATFFYYFTLKQSKNRWIWIVILLLFIVATKNPLLDRRNAIGPAYLIVFHIFFENWFTTNRRIVLTYLLLFLVFFPTTSLFTHVGLSHWSNVSLTSIWSSIIHHFSELHYDAWANLNSAIEYVNVNGHTYGKQLLGTFLFFFPRSIWQEKPLPTGSEVADYLIVKYNMWFNNLSCPIQAEGYVDFGASGVIFYAIVFSALAVYLGRVIWGNPSVLKYSAIYVSFSLMFILRGSLMSPFAYTLGTLVATYALPKGLEYLFKISDRHT